MCENDPRNFLPTDPQREARNRRLVATVAELLARGWQTDRAGRIVGVGTPHPDTGLPWALPDPTSAPLFAEAAREHNARIDAGTTKAGSGFRRILDQLSEGRAVTL